GVMPRPRAARSGALVKSRLSTNTPFGGASFAASTACGLAGAPIAEIWISPAPRAVANATPPTRTARACFIRAILSQPHPNDAWYRLEAAVERRNLGDVVVEHHGRVHGVADADTRLIGHEHPGAIS